MLRILINFFLSFPSILCLDLVQQGSETKEVDEVLKGGRAEQICIIARFRCRADAAEGLRGPALKPAHSRFWLSVASQLRGQAQETWGNTAWDAVTPK